MRSDYAVGRGPTLRKTPNYRQQAGRRRLAVVAAMAALALGSALVGALDQSTSNPSASRLGAVTGPFSYFPSE